MRPEQVRRAEKPERRAVKQGRKTGKIHGKATKSQ
jgi:hypothetical protein